MKNTPKAATKRFYFAYGSNCNLEQMEFRCPRATTVGAVTLNNYTLLFNGVASIGRRNGGQIKGVLWEITPECERSLDRYEGFPHLYTKHNVTVYTEDGTPYRTMVYVMTYNHPALPSKQYNNSIIEGFICNGIPTDTLEAALAATYGKLKTGGKKHEQIAFQ